MSVSLPYDRLIRWFPVILWMLMIFLLSSRSTVPQTAAIPTAITAALGHLVVYGILAILLYHALEQLINTFMSRATVAWLIATLYGVSDELHQSFVPGRNASVLDVGIDAVGAALGLLIVYVVMRVRRERRIAA